MALKYHTGTTLSTWTLRGGETPQLLRFQVLDSVFWDSGFRVQGSVCRVLDSGFWDGGFRVLGAGFI